MRAGGLRAELTTLYQQAVAEMQQEDFCALWTLLTVWGRTPGPVPEGPGARGEAKAEAEAGASPRPAPKEEGTRER